MKATLSVNNFYRTVTPICSSSWDQAAIEAGIKSYLSNSQTEGWINKLKLIKRQLYGRGSFELLRRKVLLAA